MGEGDRSDKPNARACGGGFFGFRESEKRGKNMGRPEEGKNVVGAYWTPEFPGPSVARCSLCRTAHACFTTCLIVSSTYIGWPCTNGANQEQAKAASSSKQGPRWAEGGGTAAASSQQKQVPGGPVSREDRGGCLCQMDRVLGRGGVRELCGDGNFWGRSRRRSWGKHSWGWGGRKGRYDRNDEGKEKGRENCMNNQSPNTHN